MALLGVDDVDLTKMFDDVTIANAVVWVGVATLVVADRCADDEGSPDERLSRVPDRQVRERLPQASAVVVNAR